MGDYTERLKATRVRLNCGEYDGTDIMTAWLAIDKLIELKESNKVLVEALNQIRKANENLDIDEVDRDSLICDIFTEFDLVANEQEAKDELL